MKNNYENRDNKIAIATKYGLPLLAVLVLLFILLIKYNFYYISNDDNMLEAIFSGAYGGTPDGHGYVSQLFPLSWIFASLYKLIPVIPWYGLFLCVAQFGTFYACLVRTMDYLDKVWKRIAGCAVLTVAYAGLMLYELVLIQYTITAAMLTAAAIFLVVTDKRSEEPTGKSLLHRLPYMILFIIGYALRKEAGILFLPFMALACLYKWVWDGPAKSRKLLQYFLFGMCLIGGMGALWGIDKLAYSSPEWKEYVEFNKGRGNIYDYVMIPNYEQNRELYESLGISQEEQFLLENYNFGLSDRYDSEVMGSINEYQTKTHGYRYTIEYVKKIIKIVIEMVEMPYRVILFILYAMALIGFLLSKRYSGFLQLLGIEGMYLLCWFYLLFWNRAPERVTHGLYLVVIVLLMAICVRQSVYLSDNSKRWRGLVITIFCTVGGISCLYNSQEKLNAEMDTVKDATQTWQIVQEYCEKNEEDLYLLDTISFADSRSRVFGKKYKSQNYTLCGGWAVNTPIYRQMLSRYGVDQSLYTSIKEGKRMYFITYEKYKVDWLENYLRSEGIESEIQCVDSIVVNENFTYLVYRIN